jgi:hypothetical protein
MSQLNVRRWTGAFGLAFVALKWAMFPLYGRRPSASSRFHLRQRRAVVLAS